MIQLIQQIPNWQTRTAEEIVSLLNDPVILVVDPALYTWAGVATIAGPVGAESLRVALEANNMGWVVHQLGGSGIQLSHPDVQMALAGFAAAGVPGAELLKATGVRHVSAMQQAGLEPADLASVQLAVRKQLLLDTATDRLQAFREALSSWTGSGEEPVL
jgi:hypothetical protein